MREAALLQWSKVGLGAAKWMIKKKILEMKFFFFFCCRAKKKGFRYFSRILLKPQTTSYNLLNIVKTWHLLNGFFSSYLLNLYNMKVTVLVCIWLFPIPALLLAKLWLINLPLRNRFISLFDKIWTVSVNLEVKDV